MNLIELANYIDTHYDDAHVPLQFKLAYYVGYRDCKNKLFEAMNQYIKEGETK